MFSKRNWTFWHEHRIMILLLQGCVRIKQVAGPDYSPAMNTPCMRSWFFSCPDYRGLRTAGRETSHWSKVLRRTGGAWEWYVNKIWGLSWQSLVFYKGRIICTEILAVSGTIPWRSVFTIPPFLTDHRWLFVACWLTSHFIPLGNVEKEQNCWNQFVISDWSPLFPHILVTISLGISFQTLHLLSSLLYNYALLLVCNWELVFARW